MDCPKCSKPTFKKYKETTETHFYYCSTCHYETQLITILNAYYDESFSIYSDKVRE